MARPTTDYFFNKVHFNESSGCLEWTGKHLVNGYGRMKYKGKNELVHRVAAAIFLGFDLTSKVDVLHRCDNRKCFNKKHLFFGNDSENQLDSVKKGRQFQSSKKTCPSGHEYSIENTYVDGTNRRHCRECSRNATRKYRTKLRS